LAAWDWTVRNFNAAVAKQDMEVGAKSLAEEARKIWISHPELFNEQESKALRAMDETEVQLLKIETELENLERCTRNIEAKKTTLNQNWSELDNR